MTQLRSFFISAVFVILGGSACQPIHPKIQLGKPLFSFDFENVQELEMINFDSEKKAWNARVKKLGNKKGRWVIAMGFNGNDFDQEGHPISMNGLDNFADGALISHLLDNLSTLSTSELAPQGPLNTMGLNPPQTHLKWHTSEKEFEILLGDSPTKDPSISRYALIPEFSRDQAYVVQGSALKILQYFKNFESVRRSIITNWTTDDVDEVTFTVNARNSLYAQRNADHWTDKNNKWLSSDVTAKLDEITHLRAKQIQDIPIQTHEIQSQLMKFEKQAIFKALFKDRHGNENLIRVALIDGSLKAWCQDRPGAFFVLHDEAKKILTLPSYLKLKVK